MHLIIKLKLEINKQIKIKLLLNQKLKFNNNKLHKVRKTIKNLSKKITIWNQKIEGLQLIV